MPQCLETRKIGKNMGGMIVYRFCCGDKETPKKKDEEEKAPVYSDDPEITQGQDESKKNSKKKKGFPLRVVIRKEDIDPNELNMDVDEFFELVRKFNNTQVESNLKYIRKKNSEAQKRQRAEDRKEIRTDLENELHCEITSGCIEYELGKKWHDNERYVKRLDEKIADKDGNMNSLERYMPLNNTLENEYFGTDGGRVYLLREFAKTLEPGSLYHAVYYHMLYRTNEEEFAKQINRSRRTVLYLRKKVKQMARQYIEENMD